MNKPSDYCIGNIDVEDIHALAKLARGASRVLEFGTGGSTQIWAQFARYGTPIETVDTERKWQDRTVDNLAKLGGYGGNVRYLQLENWKDVIREEDDGLPWFDLIFVDGLMEERERFATEAWPLLMPTGIMAFHDCRWPEVAKMSFQLAASNFLEVERIDYGINNSNVVCITKKPLMFAPCPPPPPQEPWETAHNFEAPPAGWPPKRI